MRDRTAQVKKPAPRRTDGGVSGRSVGPSANSGASSAQPAADPEVRSERARRVGHQAERLSVGARAKPLQDPKAPGKGAPLPDSLRSKMSRSFGHDFSSVRIHQGLQALALGAIAYTRGENIHFAPGRYSPKSREGVELLGHELAHVVQQRSGRVAVPRGSGAPINEDLALESEADAKAQQVLRPRDSRTQVTAAARGADAATALKSRSSRAAKAVQVSTAAPVQRVRSRREEPDHRPLLSASAALPGAGIGMGIGMLAGGPVGAAIGAGIGGLAGAALPYLPAAGRAIGRGAKTAWGHAKNLGSAAWGHAKAFGRGARRAVSPNTQDIHDMLDERAAARQDGSIKTAMQSPEFKERYAQKNPGLFREQWWKNSWKGTKDFFGKGTGKERAKRIGKGVARLTPVVGSGVSFYDAHQERKKAKAFQSARGELHPEMSEIAGAMQGHHNREAIRHATGGALGLAGTAAGPFLGPLVGNAAGRTVGHVGGMLIGKAVATAGTQVVKRVGAAGAGVAHRAQAGETVTSQEAQALMEHFREHGSGAHKEQAQSLLDLEHGRSAERRPLLEEERLRAATV